MSIPGTRDFHHGLLDDNRGRGNLYVTQQSSQGLSPQLDDTVAGGNRDPVVPRSTTTTGLEAHLWVTVGHTTTVTAVAFSPNDELLLSGSSNGLLKLWERKSGSELRQLQGHRDRISSIAFSPDGRTVATTSEDGTVRLWDPATGKQSLVLPGVGAQKVTFSSTRGQW